MANYTVVLGEPMSAAIQRKLEEAYNAPFNKTKLNAFSDKAEYSIDTEEGEEQLIFVFNGFSVEPTTHKEFIKWALSVKGAEIKGGDIVAKIMHLTTNKATQRTIEHFSKLFDMTRKVAGMIKGRVIAKTRINENALHVTFAA